MSQILFNLLTRKIVSHQSQFKEESKNIGTFVIKNIEMSVQGGNSIEPLPDKTDCMSTDRNLHYYQLSAIYRVVKSLSHNQKQTSQKSVLKNASFSIETQFFPYWTKTGMKACVQQSQFKYIYPHFAIFFPRWTPVDLVKPTCFLLNPKQLTKQFKVLGEAVGIITKIA